MRWYTECDAASQRAANCVKDGTHVLVAHTGDAHPLPTWQLAPQPAHMGGGGARGGADEHNVRVAREAGRCPGPGQGREQLVRGHVPGVGIGRQVPERAETYVAGSVETL